MATNDYETIIKNQEDKIIELNKVCSNLLTSLTPLKRKDKNISLNKKDIELLIKIMGVEKILCYYINGTIKLNLKQLDYVLEQKRLLFNKKHKNEVISS